VTHGFTASVLTTFSATQRYCGRACDNHASMGYSSTPVFCRRCGLSSRKRVHGRYMEGSALTSCASYRMRRSCTRYTKGYFAWIKPRSLSFTHAPSTFVYGPWESAITTSSRFIFTIVTNTIRTIRFLTSSTPAVCLLCCHYCHLTHMYCSPRLPSPTISTPL
jgi:hypothetical protein